MDCGLTVELYEKYCKAMPEVLGGKKRLNLEKSFAEYERAKALMPGGISGSRRPENFIEGEYPIYLERGKYGHCWDLDGNEYIDFMCGYGPVTIGYAMDEIDEAARKQTEKGFVFTLPQKMQNDLAEKIQGVISFAERVIFAKSGTDAVVIALRVARVFTQKEIILASGFHGWSDEVLAGDDGGCLEATREYTIHIPYGDADAYEEYLKKGNVAAILVSTKTGGPGTQGILYDPDFIRRMRELADEYGAVLIFDEIRNGFRYSIDGGAEELGVFPDLACYGKGCSNGYALAFTCGKAEIMEKLSYEHTMDGTCVTSTYFGNTIDMAATMAVIDFYEKNNVIQVMKEKTDYYNENVSKIIEKHQAPMFNNGYGAQPAFVFDKDGMGDELWAARTITLFTYIVRSGILIHPWRQQYFMYSHTKEDIDKSLKALDEGLAVVREMYPW